VLNDPGLFGLLPGSVEENSALAELIHEIVMLVGLHSDRIVSFQGMCVDADSGKPKHIILELASGNLAAYLKNLASELTVLQLQGISEDVLSGLEYLHTRIPAIMHRDLKPANVLVFVGAGRVTCKIGDVGLAKFAATSSLSSHRPTQGAGTPYYMAPEVMMGLGYDHSVDVFSFGVMIAEIVATKMMKPPRKTGDIGTRMKVVADAVEYLRPLSEPLAFMLEGCCHVDAASRLSASVALEYARSAVAVGRNVVVYFAVVGVCALNTYS
jgi:WNK lysine deficient protein kinase